MTSGKENEDNFYQKLRMEICVGQARVFWAHLNNNYNILITENRIRQIGLTKLSDFWSVASSWEKQDRLGENYFKKAFEI